MKLTGNRPRIWPLSTWALGLVAFLLVRPAIGLLHELLVVILALALHAAATAPLWSSVIGALPIDPVYTLAMIRFAGEIGVRGIAVADPFGAALHAALPSLFVAPEPGTVPWASAVVEPGSTVTARALAGFGANVGTLAVGIVLFRLGRRGRPWLVICGALQQAHVVLYQILDRSLSLADLEAAGLPFALSDLVSDPAHRAPWFTTELARLPTWLVSLTAAVCLTALAYLIIGGVLGAPRAVAWVGGRLRGVQRPPGRPLPRRLGISAAIYGLGIVGLALTPLGAFAQAQTRVLDQDPATLAAPPVLRPDGASYSGTGPSLVEVVGHDYQYTLLVDGRPTTIRGMGYNVQYGSLTPDERAAHYDRDFALIRASGVNVLFGWFPDVFGHDTLRWAHRHDLGVGMPYELNQDLDYDDPALRARLTADVLRWVTEYKDDPSVWFWTPGNEVIHRLIFPSWLQHTRDAAREARADSFARFYVELIDQIHTVDPNHPVVYRDAEEVYLARIRDQLQRDPKPRPWFLYGANVYSSRLAEIVDNWPKQGLDVPLFISEFSPGGTGPADRPRGLQDMWATIRRHPEWVLGGSVYAWTTEGPEELDRVFGLVDGNDLPRDGSLAAVAEFYRRDPSTN